MGGQESDDDARRGEPERKRLHLDTFSCSLNVMANSSLTSPDAKIVDAAVLQYQNQRLVQQLEAKKSEVHALEDKFEELKERQASYVETLINVNRFWNQMIDDITLFELRLGGNPIVLQELDNEDRFRDMVPSCPPNEMFLRRLLRSHDILDSKESLSTAHVFEALNSRCTSTLNLMQRLKDSINTQRANKTNMTKSLEEKISSEEDTHIQLQKLDKLLRQEVDNLQMSIDFFNAKHNKYKAEIQSYLESHCKDQSDIKRLSGELEESMAELEESRRKMINLKMQRDGLPKVQSPIFNVVNGGSSPDKPAERNMSLKKLKSSLEDAKVLSASRLAELEEAQEDVSILSKRLEDLEDDLKDEKYVVSSKPYSILNDQLQQLKVELERYKVLVESLQTDRNHILRKDKELSAKAESVDAASDSMSNANAKMEELQIQLQKCTIERNDLEIKLEEALQDAGRKDIKDEIRVMATALSKEMEMMEAQLNRCKDASLEATSLRAEACSLEGMLDKKIIDHQRVSDMCSQQILEIKSLKMLIEKLENEKKELTIFLDMYGQQLYDNRPITEIKDSEHRAKLQAEALKTALDEHSLELRVKAAREAEVACEQRLLAAESEITDLRTKLDGFERDVLEVNEAIRVKDAEAESYISEIEAIGQAYEDMQAQNQRLSQQIADRDDFNIKLVADSVKMKQSHSSLLSEKQAVVKQLQQVLASLEYLRSKIARGEEQMKGLLSQALKTSAENRHRAISIDRAKLELTGAEKELKWLSSAVDSYEKEYKQNQQNIADMQAELEIERADRKRLEEELAELKAEVDEMSVENQAATIQKLQDEIKECKSILKCGVCFDRPKEVVITKCFHLFCSPCIQRNLEIRHRKCPGCGTPFGQNDVREVNI